MGSFAFTCGISGLPIEAGDKVRFLLLTRNPYYHDGGNDAVYIDDLWFPRTFPLQARYNDYGSVEEVEEGPTRDLWLEGLKIDLVEQGWGDNSCHDVPTHKDMTFEELLRALSEGRVLVQREVGAFGMIPRQVIPGVPTLAVIEGIFKKEGLPFYKGDFHNDGFLIDEKSYGYVRIRWNGNGETYGTDEKQLSSILPHLSEFSTMLSAGDGPYAHSAELTVRPKPGNKDYHGGRETLEDSLAVANIMIREDVWQELLKMPHCERPLKVFHEMIHTAYKEFVRIGDMYRSPERTGENELLRRVMLETTKQGLFKDNIPFTVGLGTQLRLMADKGQLSESFTNTVAEFYFVQHILRTTRYQWHPSTSAGPQCGEWGAHTALLRGFAKIAAHRDKELAKLRSE